MYYITHKAPLHVHLEPFNLIRNQICLIIRFLLSVSGPIGRRRFPLSRHLVCWILTQIIIIIEFVQNMSGPWSSGSFGISNCEDLSVKGTVNAKFSIRSHSYPRFYFWIEKTNCVILWCSFLLGCFVTVACGSCYWLCLGGNKRPVVLG